MRRFWVIFLEIARLRSTTVGIYLMFFPPVEVWCISETRLDEVNLS